VIDKDWADIRQRNAPNCSGYIGNQLPGGIERLNAENYVALGVRQVSLPHLKWKDESPTKLSGAGEFKGGLLREVTEGNF
jgi:hypothetical protein